MIDLADYTKSIRDALKKGGYACVYVASTDAPKPCRISYAEDLAPAVGRMQRASPAPVAISSVLWVPDRGIATTIAKAVQCDLAPHAKAGGWFDIEPETAATAIEIASVRIYAGAAMAWHDQLMVQWKLHGQQTTPGTGATQHRGSLLPGGSRS